MKAQIVTAVLLSVVLVVGATWFRFTSTQNPPAQLVVVAGSGELREINAEEFFALPAQGEVPTTTLTQTDVVSRQLFSDYIGLKSSGQATPENLNRLAEQYANTMFAEEEADAKVTLSQLNIVADSNQALIDYNQKVLAMRSKYESMIKSLTVQSDFSDITDPLFIKFMLAVSTTYEQAVAELRKMAVPTSLAGNHLNLINNYFSSIKATRSISQIAENPISALAALSTQSKNSQEEEALVANIKVLLMSRGIYSNNL